MSVSEEYLKFIKEQLADLGNVEIKRMFGGIGIFKNGMMFGMISADNTFRLKVDDRNRADYEAKGMKQHYMPKKKKGMPYWEVPADVISDKKELAIWASKALDAAMRKKKVDFELILRLFLFFLLFYWTRHNFNHNRQSVPNFNRFSILHAR